MSDKREEIRISETKDGKEVSLVIRKIENGYIKQYTESGDEEDGKWYHNTKEVYVETLPDEYKTMMEDMTPKMLSDKIA